MSKSNLIVKIDLLYTPSSFPSYLYYSYNYDYMKLPLRKH